MKFGEMWKGAAAVASALVLMGCPADPPANNGDTDAGGNECSSTCLEGEFQCLNENTLLSCVIQDDGCFGFGDAQECPAGNICRAGSCRPDEGGGCTDLCSTTDGPRCNLQGRSEVCIDSDGDGCFEYANPTDCSADGKFCDTETGACAEIDCGVECVAGEAQCEDELISTCAEDARGCLVLGPAKDCADGEVCEAGACVTPVTCESECDPAEGKLCGPGGTPRECVDSNADSCFEYVDATACAAGSECRSGECVEVATCEDECKAGGTSCDGDRIRSCEDTNADSCVEFTIAAACPTAGEFCDSSSGVAVCAAPPQTGAVVINEVFYDALGDDLRNANMPNEESPVFIELFGPPNLPIAGFEVDLVNGRNGMSYQRVALPADATLSGDGYALILMEQADFFLALSTANEYLILTKPSAGSNQDAMQNGSDSVVLYDAGGTQVDAVGYGAFSGTDVFTGEGSAAEDVIGGRSLGRAPGALDTDDNSVDFRSYYPTPGLPNSDLVITEAYVDQPGSDGVDGSVETFVELSAPIQGWEEISLEGYTLRGINGNDGSDYIFTVAGAPTPGIPLTWLDDPVNVTGNIKLGSNGRIVVCNIEASAALSDKCDTYYEGVDWQNGPDSIVLEYNGRVVDALGYGTFSGNFSGEGAAGRSLNRWPYRDPSKKADTDDNATDFHLADPTPGTDNAFPATP